MVRDYLLQKVTYYFPDWRQRVEATKAAIGRWGRTVRLSLLKLAVLFVLTGGVYAIILIYAKSFWFTYQGTNVGKTFLQANPSSIFIEIFSALEGNIFVLSYRLCLELLVVGLGVGLLGQFLALRRYFYYGRGIAGHIVWSAAFAICAAIDILDVHSFSFLVGLSLYAIPSLCLHDRCLKLCSFLVPEFLIIFELLGKLKKLRQVAKMRGEFQ